MSTSTLRLYDQVSYLTKQNLGDVAEDLVEQQIRDRLHKDPEKLSRDDLKRLISWISALASLITDDMDKVGAYVIKLKRLADIKP